MVHERHVVAARKRERGVACLRDVSVGVASNDPSFDRDLLIVTIPVRAGTRVIDLVRTLDDAGIDAVDINRRQATLDDVFLTVTTDRNAAGDNQ